MARIEKSDIEYQKKIGNRLKELRIRQSLKQSDVGKIFGKSARTISNYEDGSSGLTTEMIQKYCDYFHVPSDWILGIKKVAVPELGEDATAEMDEDFTLTKDEWKQLKQILAENRPKNGN